MKFSIQKLVTAGVAATMLLSSMVIFPSSGVSAAGAMTADEITENMSIGWNIGNSLDSTGTQSATDPTKQETNWGNPVVTQALIDTVKAKGFNTIRIPTTWYPNVTQTSDANGNPVYTISDAWLGRVKEVVDYAYKNDMYVILNLHHEEWINRSDFATAYDEMSPRLIQMWQQIATYFKDYDQHLIFEGMNEPREVGTATEWQGNAACYEVVNKLDADFINTVRSIDSPYKDSRLLMIPSYAASSYASSYSALTIPDDDYVAVSIHAYTPYNFAMGDGDHTTFSSRYMADLDTLFSDIQYYFTDKDIPVVLGEFSASNFNNTDARCDWANYYMSWTKKLGIPCVLWDNNAISNSSSASEAHGYLNRSNNTWYEASEPVVDAMMAVINDDNVAWGSESHLPNWQHSDITTGDIIYDNPAGLNLIAAAEGSNCTPGQDISTNHLNADKEIAIKYTGSVAPILAICNSSWGNWTEISAYDIDEENGIAYYSFESISKAWGSDVSTAVHLFARAGSDMTIYTIAAIPAATLSTNPTDPTEPTDPTDPTEPTEDDILLGDVMLDGDVTISDAVKLQKYLLGTENLVYEAYLAADTNQDGDVNGMDLSVLRQMLMIAPATV